MGVVPNADEGITPGPLQTATAIGPGAGGVSGLYGLDQPAAEELLKSLYIAGNPSLDGVLAAIYNGIRSGVSMALGIVEAVVKNIAGLSPSTIFLSIEHALTSLQSWGTGIVTGIIAGFGGIFTGWSGQASTATTVTEAVDEAAFTAEAIRASVAGGFTLQTWTASDPAWPVPPELASAAEAYVGVFGASGLGTNGQAVTGGGNADGGEGGSSGGYTSRKIDPAALAATLAIVIGAGATTPGADGGVSSITSGATVLVASVKNVGQTAYTHEWLPSLSLPGIGGRGGDAGPGAALDGQDGASVGFEAGGVGGAGAFNGSGGATGTNGGAGTAGQTTNTPLSGGTGGAGGGAAYITGAAGHAQGGNGASGGYPGGGPGGGGAASASNLGTSGGGVSGVATHGLGFALWR